jgi:phosphoglucomutase
MYVESYEPDAARQALDPQSALAELVTAGIALAEVRERTGREGPTVVT